MHFGRIVATPGDFGGLGTFPLGTGHIELAFPNFPIFFGYFYSNRMWVEYTLIYGLVGGGHRSKFPRVSVRTFGVNWIIFTQN